MHTAIFILYTAAIAFVSLRPATSGGIELWDKAVHAAVYCIFAILGRQVVAGQGRYLALCLGIVVYGGLMEVAQSFTPDREMSGLDALANTVGVALGWAVSTVALRARGRP